MDTVYDANQYLSTNDLNEIENTIESLTIEVQEKLFNDTPSPLHNIEVGDKLN